MLSRFVTRIFRHFVLGIALLACASPALADNDFATDFAGADVNIGERLFLETRFSQYFFTNSGGDANATLPGDPVVSILKTRSGQVPGPFVGQAMNCRQCHLVDEEGNGPFGNHTLGNRTYADFARRSPIPSRNDGHTETTRNAQVLVDALLPHDGPVFLHYDGQFATVHDLIIATLTGRNYGWKPEEYQTAVHHIATVIRNDDGMGYLATRARGGRFDMLMSGMALPGEVSYANVLSGFTRAGQYLFDPRTLTPQLISPQYRISVNAPNTTDKQILDTVATLIEAYLRNLVFSQATNGVDFVGVGTPVFNGSPFDVFLIKNGLPQSPAVSETSAEYSHRLLQLVDGLVHPIFVTNSSDGEFTTQTQSFTFGPNELEGLKIFLRDQNYRHVDSRASVGNCAACHPPPAFTDFIFHNTGATEEEYNALHGPGRFQLLRVPDFATRQANYDAYLPPTPLHPFATGRFESPPNVNQIGNTDLGLWNVYANPDFPAPQKGLAQILPQLLGLQAPRIKDFHSGRGQLAFNGKGGNPGQIYYVLVSSNFSAPPANWEVIATNTFDPQGGFHFATGLQPGLPQRFFRLSLRIPPAAEVLPKMIARFKTSNLRDLSQSGPYLHTGRMDSLEQVIRFYQRFSIEARLGLVRNPDPELRNIFLDDMATAPLAAFLRSLDEDYTD